MNDSLFPDPGAAPAATSRAVHLQGAAGRIELLVDTPAQAPLGVAVITHPQPVLGGSPRHKVPHRLAKAAQAQGWLAVRPAFRGVGGSEGEYDEGLGETEDLLAVIAAVRAQAGGLALAMVGFSFGAFVAARATAALQAAGQAPQAIVLAGLPVGTVPAGRHYDTPGVPAHTVLVHGERDEMAPLSSVLDWARPRMHPVLVVPGADHFFNGCLDRLIACVELRLREAARESC